jgi:hypothetical protein
MSQERRAACCRKLEERYQAYAEVYGGEEVIWRFVRLNLNFRIYPHLVVRDTPLGGVPEGSRNGRWGDEGVTYLRSAVVTNLLDDLLLGNGNRTKPQEWRRKLFRRGWELLDDPWSPAIGEIAKTFFSGLFFTPRVYLAVLNLMDRNYEEYFATLNPRDRRICEENRKRLVDSLLRDKSTFESGPERDEYKITYKDGASRTRVIPLTLSSIDIGALRNIAWLCFILLAMARMTDELVGDVQSRYASIERNLEDGATQEWLVIAFCEARQVFIECGVAYNMLERLYSRYCDILSSASGVLPVIPRDLKLVIERRVSTVKYNFDKMGQRICEASFNIESWLDVVEPPLVEVVKDLVGHDVEPAMVDESLRRRYQPSRARYHCREF